MIGSPLQPDRYYPVSAYYRRRFGAKVYKVSVSVARSCPSRQGALGAGVCIFCDEWGSAAYHRSAALSLASQIRLHRERIRRRYRAEKFLVYFQAYTNTFTAPGMLEKLCRQALAEKDVIGLVIGTRPDCLPKPVVALLARLAKQHYLSVELGLQTLDDGQLRFLSRGHDRACSFAALEKLAVHAEIDVCAHLMFGLPGEGDEQLRETAACINRSGIAGVKLHNLHVLKGTPLEEKYNRGEFRPIGREEYARRVGLFLEHLSPAVAVHRLSAVASRWDRLVAPSWVREKMGSNQYIIDYLARNDLWQGKALGSAAPGGGWPGGEFLQAAAVAGGKPLSGEKKWA